MHELQRSAGGSFHCPVNTTLNCDRDRSILEMDAVVDGVMDSGLVMSSMSSATASLRRRRPSSHSERSRSRPASSERRPSESWAHHQLRKWDLLTWEQLPDWHQDNPLIRYGYRQVSFNIMDSIRSCLSIHNETMNIWTHLIPALGIVLAQSTIQDAINKHFPDATTLDRFIFTFNLAAAAITMTLSASYHTLMNHSYWMCSICLRVDYSGIIFLILGSFISGVYVGFYCMPTLQIVYWTMIGVLGISALVLVLHPQMQGIAYRNTKAMVFTLTALSGFAPIGHGLYLYGWNDMWERSGMPYWFLEGAFYGFGVLLFATRFPECWKQETFDIIGSSHQLFHILVVCGASVHLWGVWDAWNWNYRNAGGCII